MAGTIANKAYEHFRLKMKKANIIPGEVFFLTTSAASGVTFPSGALVYNTTSGVLQHGVGSTTLKTFTVT